MIHFVKYKLLLHAAIVRSRGGRAVQQILDHPISLNHRRERLFLKQYIFAAGKGAANTFPLLKASRLCSDQFSLQSLPQPLGSQPFWQQGADKLLESIPNLEPSFGPAGLAECSGGVTGTRAGTGEVPLLLLPKIVGGLCCGYGAERPVLAAGM